MLKRNCIFDIMLGENCSLNGISMQVLNDEEDYNMLCDLLEISKEER